MFYTIYLTTNKVNGKKYIGKHVTKSLEDNYLGSGLILKRAIEKYGLSNFKKEILFVFQTENEMNLKEAELVTLEVVLSDAYYNCALGGKGGSIVLKSDHPLYESTCKKISEAQNNRKENMSQITTNLHKTKSIGMYGKKQSDYQRNKISLLNKGKPKSEEQKDKQRISILKTLHAEGYTHPNKGVKKSKYLCQWCDKLIGGRSNFNRYHGEKCKKFIKDLQDK